MLSLPSVAWGCRPLGSLCSPFGRFASSVAVAPSVLAPFPCSAGWGLALCGRYRSLSSLRSPAPQAPLRSPPPIILTYVLSHQLLFVVSPLSLVGVPLSGCFGVAPLCFAVYLRTLARCPPSLGGGLCFFAFGFWVLPWRSCSVAPLSLRLIPRTARQASPLKREGKALHSPRGFCVSGFLCGLAPSPSPSWLPGCRGSLAWSGAVGRPFGSTDEKPAQASNPLHSPSPEAVGQLRTPTSKALHTFSPWGCVGLLWSLSLPVARLNLILIEISHALL